MKRKWLLTSAVTLTLSVSTLCPMVSYAAQQSGDLNNDGAVNSIDFGLYRKYLLGSHQLDNVSLGDLNGDNAANSIDFGLLRRYILGYDTEIGNFNNTGNYSDTENKLEYAEKIFGQEIISVEIIANESDWQTMLNNATKEE